MQADAIHRGFDQGVHTALAMDPDTLKLIGVLALMAIAVLGLLILRAVYRWFTR